MMPKEQSIQYANPFLFQFSFNISPNLYASYFQFTFFYDIGAILKYTLNLFTMYVRG